MKSGFLVSPVVVLLACALGGCSEQASAVASAAAGSGAKPIDQAGYCSRICQRATGCGIEAAESVARGTPAEVALVGKMKAESNETERACVAECSKERLGEADARAMAEAESCIEQTTCETFARCLDSSASASHP